MAHLRYADLSAPELQPLHHLPQHDHPGLLAGVAAAAAALALVNVLVAVLWQTGS